MYIMYTQAVITILIAILVWEVVKYLAKWIWSSTKTRYTNVFKDYLYCDANATTPMDPDALDEYVHATVLGNASTEYATRIGDIPRLMNRIDRILRKGLNLTNNHKIIWNSGASEGNNYVIRAIADTPTKDGSIPHIIASAIEHKTSILCLEQLQQSGKVQFTLIQPNCYGIIDPVEVAHAVRPNTRLITIMHTNNELGSVNPIYEIGRVAKRYKVFFHTDAAQAFGKHYINVQDCALDAVTSSMHKVYGPLGTGLLILSPRFLKEFGAQPQVSGMQYNGLRGGTENIPVIAASLVALQKTWYNRTNKNYMLRKQKLQIVSALDKEFGLASYIDMHGQPDTFRLGAYPGIRVVVLGEVDCFGYPSQTSSPSTLLMSIVKTGNYPDEERFCNIVLKNALLDRKIIISIGSACNTGNAGPSHVLTAIKAPYIVRSGTIRISLLDGTSDDDIQKLIKNLCDCIRLQCQIQE